MEHEFDDKLKEARVQRQALRERRQELDELNRTLQERQKEIGEALDRVRMMKELLDTESNSAQPQC